MLRLAYHGNPRVAEHKFEKQYGRECPEWLLEQARPVSHHWEQVETIAGPLGFYREPTDPLPPVKPPTHRSEVFDNELECMTPVAEELVTALLDADTVIREMPYADKYRTDLAICEIDSDALARRLAITTGDDRSLVDKWKFFKGYRFLRTAPPLTAEEFYDRGPYNSRSENKRVWNRLKDMGLISMTGEYGSGVNVPIHITAHAVELKQRDWETAFTQARRAALPQRESDHYAPNRYPRKYGYADYCWVVMDAGHVEDALAHRDRFENGGVGLIALDDGGAVKLIDARKFSPPQRSLDREHLNEKALDAIEVDEYVDRSTISRQVNLSELA